MGEPTSRTPEEERGAALAAEASRLPTSAPPKLPSLRKPDGDVPEWITDVIEMMAARFDQSVRLNREAWENLSQASQTMLATAKVMQALIGSFDATLTQLGTVVGNLGTATAALTNLYGEYDAFLQVLMDEEAEEQQESGQNPART